MGQAVSFMEQDCFSKYLHRSSQIPRILAQTSKVFYCLSLWGEGSQVYFIWEWCLLYRLWWGRSTCFQKTWIAHKSHCFGGKLGTALQQIVTWNQWIFGPFQDFHHVFWLNTCRYPYKLTLWCWDHTPAINWICLRKWYCRKLICHPANGVYIPIIRIPY